MPEIAKITPTITDISESISSAFVKRIAPSIKNNIELSNEDCFEYYLTFISITYLFSIFIIQHCQLIYQ